MTDQRTPTEVQADAAARAGQLQEARRLLEQVVAQSPDRQQAWVKLAAMCRASGDLPAGLSALSRALALDPLDFSALLAKAMLLEKTGATAAAGEAYGHALAQRPLPGQEPPALKPMLAHAEDRWRAHQSAVLESMRGSLEQQKLSGEEQVKLERFCSNIARITKPYSQQPTHFHYPGLPVYEFHPRSLFPWIETLEAAAHEIRAEFHALLASEAAELAPYVQYPDDVPLRQWQALNHSRDWTAIHLLRLGDRVEKNARHCPRTLELINSLPIPRVRGRSPTAMFSLLAPRTNIPAHNGVDNSRLVVHLPLVVPPNCSFRVGAETRQWEAGNAFVFDDTIEHEASNGSDEVRVVLIFDVWAWALSEAERNAIASVIVASNPDPAAAAL